MNSREKVRRLFGLIERLDERIHWPVGLSNMLEWLAWDPKHILGISKNHYRKLIVKWSHEEGVLDKPLEHKVAQVRKRLEDECRKHEQTDPYSRKNKS